MRVVEIDLAIVKLDPDVVKRRAYAFLSNRDLLSGVRVSTKHNVVATRLER